MKREGHLDGKRESFTVMTNAILDDIKPTGHGRSVPRGDNPFWDYFWQGLANQLVTVQEAADIRETSRIAVYNLLERGRLRTIELARKKFLIRKDVEEFERERPGPKNESRRE